jgi:hypothetical protein
VLFATSSQKRVFRPKRRKGENRLLDMAVVGGKGKK